MPRPVLLISLAIWVVVTTAPAPLQGGDGDTAVKAKRAEEMIMFGNHQNNARVKKTDPDMPFAGQDVIDDVIDKKAKLAVDTASAEDKSESSPDVADSSSEKEATDGSNSGEATASGPPADSRESSKENPSGANVENVVDSNEAELSNLNEVTKQPEDKTEDEEEAEESSGEADQDMEQYYFQTDEGKLPPEYYEYLDLGNEYYYPGLGPRRPAAGGRFERSAPLLTAEDMGGQAGGKETRFKRDLGLSEDDLRALLEEDAMQGQLPYEEDEAPYEYPDSDRLEDEATVSDIRGLLEQLVDTYGTGNAADEGYPEEEEIEEEEEEEEIPYEEEAVAEDGYPYLDEEDLEAARAKLALLRYMYAEGQADGEEEEEEDFESPQEVEETWDDLGPAPYDNGPSYEMIDYRGKRGIFIPMKRQYLSFVPGNKRSFYPYSYGPDGRWGAFVPQVKDEKRAEEDMYDRLYQLAQALRDRQDIPEEEWKKK